MHAGSDIPVVLPSFPAAATTVMLFLIASFTKVVNGDCESQ